MNGLIGEPGHWREGARTNHFLGLCSECDAHTVQTMSLDDVETAYRRGHMSEAKFLGYRWAWMTGSFKFGTFPASWSEVPADGEARAFGEAVKALSALQKKAQGA